MKNCFVDLFLALDKKIDISAAFLIVYTRPEEHNTTNRTESTKDSRLDNINLVVC